MKGAKNGIFRRLTGVNRALFEMMVQIVSVTRNARRRHPSRGLQAKLCVEDQLLLTLMYYRKYRSLLHSVCKKTLDPHTVAGLRRKQPIE